mmetsp:Transcript_19408/g.37960  ORF Transcript_19408/g.37960 Transcript_19408/m.37960 type:complete len:310 (-) Transcript_19408:110-1039(-)
MFLPLRLRSRIKIPTHRLVTVVMGITDIITLVEISMEGTWIGIKGLKMAEMDSTIGADMAVAAESGRIGIHTILTINSIVKEVLPILIHLIGNGAAMEEIIETLVVEAEVVVIISLLLLISTLVTKIIDNNSTNNMTKIPTTTVGRRNISNSNVHRIHTTVEAEWKVIAEAKGEVVPGEEEERDSVKSHLQVAILQMDLHKFQVVAVTEAESMDNIHRIVITTDGVVEEEETEEIIAGEVRRQVVAGILTALLRTDGMGVVGERDRGMITAILGVIKGVVDGDLRILIFWRFFPKLFVQKWERCINHFD